MGRVYFTTFLLPCMCTYYVDRHSYARARQSVVVLPFPRMYDMDVREIFGMPDPRNFNSIPSSGHELFRSGLALAMPETQPTIS